MSPAHVHIESAGARPTAADIHAVHREEGTTQLARPWPLLAVSALGAGLTMGLSFSAMALLHAALPDTPWRHLVTSLGYVVGFVLVVLGRAELFTEKTLPPVVPVLQAPSWLLLGRLLRLWAVVLAGNLVGGALFAWFAYSTEAFGPEVRSAFREIGVAAAGHGFGEVIAKGVMAGWLIASMAWLMPASPQHRLGLIVMLTYLVALGHFTHVITGGIEVMYAALAGAISWPHAVLGYILPALIGNMLGGIGFVALLNHGQTRGES